MVEDKPGRGGRPFRLVDGMILTAATAVGLVGVRVLMEALGPLTYRADLSTGRRWVVAAETYAIIGSPLLAAWSAAVIPIRLIPPRPSRRRLGVQPGMAAACATVVAVAAMAGTALVCILTLAAGFFDDPATWVVAGPGMVSLAILASWTTLALGRRWRPEPGWIDRLGRVLALAWFAAWLCILHLLHLG